MNSTNSTSIAETLASNKNRYISGIVISSVFILVYFTYLIGCFIYFAIKKIKGLGNNEKNQQTDKSTTQDSMNFDLDEDLNAKKKAKTVKEKISEWIASRQYDIEKISFVFYLVLFELFAVSMFWIFFEFQTSATSSQTADYKNLIDVALMTLLGLGLSMSCIKNAQYHTIGMAILLAALSFQLTIIAQGFWSKIMEYATLKDSKTETTFNTVVYLDMKWLVHGFYGAFTVLISTSVVIGKTSPVQLILMAFSEIFIYSVNYFCIILVLGAIDYGGSMFIHVFGACYGLSASWSLYKPAVFQSQVFENHHSKSSDMIAIIGTVLLWVLMPSFNAALISNAQYQYRAHITTFIAMASSCVIHFVIMRLIRGKFHMRDLQRGAIAGGISMASVQSVIVSPGGSLTIGLVAGTLVGVSLCALQPLIKKLRIYDTCNVFSTHLLIGMYGGLVSIIATGNAIDNASKFKIYGDDTKTVFGTKYTNLWGFQICALCITIVTSIAGGFLHGFVYNKWLFVLSPEKTFEDSAFWILPKEPKNTNVVSNSGDQEMMVQCTVCKTIEEKLKYSHQELKKSINEKCNELEKKNVNNIALNKDHNEKQVNELKEAVKSLEEQVQKLLNSLNNSQIELAKKEEEERKRRELEEKMKREQDERKKQEEEARRKKEEDEKKRKEEDERLRKLQQEEDERKRKAQLEEEERKKKAQLEEDERKRKLQQDEDERKRKAQIEEDERKRKAQLEEEERKKKAQLEEDERKRKAQLEEEERKRKEEEEHKKNEELSQMSKVMQDLLSKSTATEDESGARYQSFEGINVDYNVLSVFDMLRGEELLGFDDSVESMDDLDSEDDDGETDLSEYEKLHKHSQKKSSYIVLHYKDGKINNKMLFYKKGLRFKEFMPELNDDSMFHIIFRVRCKESGGITLFKYLVATYAGDNVRAMHKGILTGNANTLGKFFGIISYQVIEREKIKEEVIEKMKTSATGNVQKMTFFIQ